MPKGKSTMVEETLALQYIPAKEDIIPIMVFKGSKTSSKSGIRNQLQRFHSYN
tara:strand:+ start:1200 stop:1358 length:159 start_codon:yes stop_codon:yes gene_type:complete